MYDVRIYNRDMKLKKVIPSKKLSDLHWKKFWDEYATKKNKNPKVRKGIFEDDKVFYNKFNEYSSPGLSRNNSK